MLESNLLEKMNQQKSLIRVQIEHHHKFIKKPSKVGINHHINKQIS